MMARGSSLHVLLKKRDIKPFLANVPMLQPLKIPKNQRFSGVFWGYKMGTLNINGLIEDKHVCALFTRLFVKTKNSVLIVLPAKKKARSRNT